MKVKQATAFFVAVIVPTVHTAIKRSVPSVISVQEME